ncbi:MAG: hypothetical protein K8S87_01140 [Planctomycetes bacterium]|nr:hypothetical protein [Planctomycetota bacterium]
MKILLVIPDGWSDTEQPKLHNRTPLEVADMTTVKGLAFSGIVGTAEIITEEERGDTSYALLKILGVENAELTGRGYYEALDWGIELAEGEFAARVQLSMSDGKAIVTPNSGNLTTAETRELINLLNAELPFEKVKFHFSNRKNQLVTFMGEHEYLPNLSSPWEVLNKEFASYFPSQENELTQLMRKCAEILEKAEINEVRKSLGEQPVNFAYIWGMGQAKKYQTMKIDRQIRLAMVSYSTMARGIGLAAGAKTVYKPEEDKSSRKELRYLYQETRKALVNHDIVAVHLGFTDNYTKVDNPMGKVNALRTIDENFITPIVEDLKQYEDHRFLLIPSIGSNSITKTHLKQPVPFLAWGEGITHVQNNGFTEASAAESGIKIKSDEKFLEKFLF